MQLLASLKGDGEARFDALLAAGVAGAGPTLPDEASGLRKQVRAALEMLEKGAPVPSPRLAPARAADARRRAD